MFTPFFFSLPTSGIGITAKAERIEKPASTMKKKIYHQSPNNFAPKPISIGAKN